MRLPLKGPPVAPSAPPQRHFYKGGFPEIYRPFQQGGPPTGRSVECPPISDPICYLILRKGPKISYRLAAGRTWSRMVHTYTYNCAYAKKQSQTSEGKK